MFDHTLRIYKDDLLRPLAVHLSRVPPNWITLTAMLVGLIAACAAAFQWQWIALGLWLTNRILDGLDGVVARTHARQSDFGGYLDIVSDFVVYAAIPICIYWCNQSPLNALALALLLASFYINAASWIYLSAILEKRSVGARVRRELTTVVMPVTLVGGTETIAFYCLFLLWQAALPWLFALMAILVLIGVGVRLHWARRHLT